MRLSNAYWRVLTDHANKGKFREELKTVHLSSENCTTLQRVFAVGTAGEAEKTVITIISDTLMSSRFKSVSFLQVRGKETFI